MKKKMLLKYSRPRNLSKIFWNPTKLLEFILNHIVPKVNSFLTKLRETNIKHKIKRDKCIFIFTYILLSIQLLIEE